MSSDLTGIDCGADCMETFAPSTAVTLTAVADAGSVFNGWGGACTGLADCALTLDAMHSVTAEFALPNTDVLVFTFLPLIVNDYPSGPDLIVAELLVSGSDIEGDD